MELSQIQRDIVEAVNHHLGIKELSCGLCGNATWLPPNIVTHPEVVIENGATFKPTLTGQVIPLAILTCDHCGNTLSVNLVRLGLWQKWQSGSQIVIPTSIDGNLRG